MKSELKEELMAIAYGTPNEQCFKLKRYFQLLNGILQPP